VTQCFFHCAKAFRRSSLWDPATWPPRLRVSFGQMFVRKQGLAPELAHKIDASIEENYRTEL
jgi:hypothetical protein